MNNTAWKSERERAAEVWTKRYGETASLGFQRVRVHELKHTFGRRLRAAGVSFEDRQDLFSNRGKKLPRGADEFTAFLNSYIATWAGQTGVL